MKRLFPTLLAVTVVLLAAAPAAGAAKYRGIVTCNSFSGKQPDSSCVIGDLPGAVFQALRASRVRYRVCVIAPGGTRCAFRTTGAHGQRSRVPINLRSTGTYHVTWKARGKIRARASFEVRPEGV